MRAFSHSIGQAVTAGWCVVFIASGVARAEPDPSERRQTGECPRPTASRVHEGFFFRSSPGLALFEATVSPIGTEPRRSRIEGVGLSSALSVGATPMAGWVLGATLWTVNLSPRFVEGGAWVTPDDDSVKLTVLRVGPFVDWYPNPRRGFHSSLASAWMVQIERDTRGKPIRPIATGPTFASYAGYEWFVSGEFSVGVLGGLAFGQLRRKVNGQHELARFVMPELALTVTYH